MPSMLPLLIERARVLQARVDGARATLDLLNDCGMNTREHENSHSYLVMRLAAIQNDIAILEKGYALKESRHEGR